MNISPSFYIAVIIFLGFSIIIIVNKPINIVPILRKIVFYTSQEKTMWWCLIGAAISGILCMCFKDTTNVYFVVNITIFLFLIFLFFKYLIKESK